MFEIPSDSKEEEVQPFWVEVHGIKLTQADKEIVLNGEWLTDSIIHAAQLLIKNDHTLLPLGSLQDPILGKTLSFDVATEECANSAFWRQPLGSHLNRWYRASASSRV